MQVEGQLLTPLWPRSQCNDGSLHQGHRRMYIWEGGRGDGGGGAFVEVYSVGKACVVSMLYLCVCVQNSLSFTTIDTRATPCTAVSSCCSSDKHLLPMQIGGVMCLRGGVRRKGSEISQLFLLSYYIFIHDRTTT